MAAARKARGLTQVQLADALGVSQKKIDHYERRAKRLDAQFVGEIAAALAINVSALIGEEEPRQKPATSALEQRIARLRQLSRKEQEIVVKMLDGLLNSTSDNHP
jgi:transcriptional regulator with XRE-family HTH domain